MIIYNPNDNIMDSRIRKAQEILDSVSVKHCFISGSFLYSKKYNDIDLFVVSRGKINLKFKDKKVKVTVIDFNDMHSLFFHSISKSCISNNILPKKDLKVTVADYWDVVNEAVPTILNSKNKYHKSIRFLVLYTEYFKSGKILDSFELSKLIKKFKGQKDILEYIEKEIPLVVNKSVKKSYIKRFFYTQSGIYKDLREYKAQSFLYELTHKITRGIF